MDTSRIDHERLRERIQPCYHMQTFCKVENLDKEYLRYTILCSLKKHSLRIHLGAWIREKFIRISTATSDAISIQKPQRGYGSSGMEIDDRKIS